MSLKRNWFYSVLIPSQSLPLPSCPSIQSTWACSLCYRESLLIESLWKRLLLKVCYSTQCIDQIVVTTSIVFFLCLHPDYMANFVAMMNSITSIVRQTFSHCLPWQFFSLPESWSCAHAKQQAQLWILWSIANLYYKQCIVDMSWPSRWVVFQRYSRCKVIYWKCGGLVYLRWSSGREVI